MTDIMKLADDYAAKNRAVANVMEQGTSEELIEAEGDKKHSRAALQSAIDALQAENERLKVASKAWHHEAITTKEREKTLQAKLDELTAENSLMVERTGYLSVEVLVDNYLTMRSQLGELQKQEPVASVDHNCEPHKINWEVNPLELADGVSLYAAPKALEPLTDEQVEALVDIAYKHWQNQRIFDIAAVRADFRAHGITKGTP